MQNRVIITGASGFVGRIIVSELRILGWEVIPVVREPSGLKGEYIINPDSKDFFDKLSSLPKSKSIIHLASHVDFSESANIGDFYTTNILYTSCLVQLSKLWSAQLIFSSGIIVYDDIEYINQDTIVTDNPLTQYGRAKLLAESIIISAGIDYTILRIPGIYGDGGPQHLGINSAITNAIDSYCEPILKGKGSAKRNYIYVYDLIDNIHSCLEKKILGEHLIAGGEVVTIKQMLESVCELLLNGVQLINRPGEDAMDKVIEKSTHFPKGRSFVDALLDIKARNFIK